MELWKGSYNQVCFEKLIAIYCEANLIPVLWGRLLVVKLSL